MSINKNLRQLRLNSGMTQEQAAEKLGVTRQALSSYELGRTRPDIDMLMSLAQVYGTDLDGILYGVSRKLKAARKVKAAATVIFILSIALTILCSAILWSANHFFSISEGQMTQEKRELFEIRRALLTAWETMDEIFLTAAIPFAVTDPVYKVVDYMITPVLVVFRVLFFLGTFLLTEYLMKRKNGTCIR